MQTAVGLWLPFRITDFEQDAAWSWIVAGIPATGHRVRAIDPQNCRLTFTVPAWAPFYLPVDAEEGDWIEIGQTGAYSNSAATRFNGFFPETFVSVDAPPLLPD